MTVSLLYLLVMEILVLRCLGRNFCDLWLTLEYLFIFLLTWLLIELLQASGRCLYSCLSRLGRDSKLKSDWVLVLGASICIWQPSDFVFVKLVCLPINTHVLWNQHGRDFSLNLTGPYQLTSVLKFYLVAKSYLMNSTRMELLFVW